jgi:hypothetical protein
MRSERRATVPLLMIVDEKDFAQETYLDSQPHD